MTLTATALFEALCACEGGGGDKFNGLERERAAGTESEKIYNQHQSSVFVLGIILAELLTSLCAKLHSVRLYHASCEKEQQHAEAHQSCTSSLI